MGRVWLAVVWAGAFATCLATDTVTLELEQAPAKMADGGSYRYLPQMMKLYEKADEFSHQLTMRMHNASLYGGITSIGEYFTRIRIGGQVFRVQIDTGSSTLAIPLSRCRTCLDGDFRYQSRRSPSKAAQSISCDSNLCGANTCHARCKQCMGNKCCSEEDPSLCGFFLRYGDGSGAQGALMYDYMEWGGIGVDGFFGGILKDSRDFEQEGVDGILGLAYASLACTPTCVDPIFDVMVKDAGVRDIFSICLAESGGTITLGSYDKRTLASDITWVPMVYSSRKTFYTVALPGYMKIGEANVPLQKFRSAIVDSGTTLIVMTMATFLGVRKHISTTYCDIPGLCGYNSWFKPAVCVQMSDSIFKQMPSLTFYVGSNQEPLELKPEHYMLPFETGGKTYRCVGIMTSDGISEVDVILGNTLNMRYVTIYDREHNRMGFAKRTENCGTSLAECASHFRCEDCVRNSVCEFNYSTKQCSEKNLADTSFKFPYPTCSGTFCFCKMNVKSWIYNAALGVGIGLLAVSVVLLLSRFAATRASRRGYQTIQ